MADYSKATNANFDNMSNIPNIIGENKDNKIMIGRGTVSDEIPTNFSNWIDITDVIDGEDGIFQFFPEREEMTYSSQADDGENTILGKRGAISEPLVFLWNKKGKYTWNKIVQWQKNEDGSMGNCAWLGLYSVSDMMSNFVKLTIDDKIPSQKGTIGEFAKKEFKIGAKNAKQVDGNAFETDLTPLSSPTLSDASSTKTISWNAIANAVGYRIYRGTTLIKINDSTSTDYVYSKSDTYSVQAMGDRTAYSDSELSSITVTI